MSSTLRMQTKTKTGTMLVYKESAAQYGDLGQKGVENTAAM